MWAEEGAPLRAGAFLIKALELAPNEIDSRLNLTRVYLALGRISDARKEAITLLEKAPNNGEALMALVDTSHTPEEIAATEEQLAKFPQKDSAYYHLAVGGIAEKKSDLSGAEAALQRAVAADPNFAGAHSALAALYLARKENEKAGLELEKVENSPRCARQKPSGSRNLNCKMARRKKPKPSSQTLSNRRPISSLPGKCSPGSQITKRSMMMRSS